MSLTQDAFRAFARISPRDRQDARFYLNASTLDQLAQERLDGNIGDRLFGLPVEVDDNLPDGVINCLAETELDRVIRRATEAGRYINIVKSIPFEPVIVPAPIPTFRALIRHWWKMVRRAS